MNNKNYILNKISNKIGQIAILIDPEKNLDLLKLKKLILHINKSKIDYIFIGGSTSTNKEFKSCIKTIKENSKIPTVIFPGSNQQISKKANALLYLSLISGNNPKYLIEQHVESANKISKIDIEIIPTGYILIDGGAKTSVEKVSQTKPIEIKNKTLIKNTVLAGKFLGKKIIFFDAGSGAIKTVPKSIIKKTKEIDIPVIVGGGIKNLKDIYKMTEAGANVIVIGNEIEKNNSFLDEIEKYKSQIINI